MKAWDAIVIGGGHNGLVNACYLQRAGLDVLVVEKNDWVGGAATSRELTPGFLYSNCSYVCSLFRPEIMRDLELPRFGLQVISYEGGAVFTRDGDYLANYRDHDAHRREFARFSRRDAEAYDRYSRDVTRQCRFIQPLLMRTAPDPTSFKPRDLGEMLYLGKKFAGLTAEEMALTLRFWTMSISDFLDEYFETDVIKANFALSGIIGTALGPMSPGTAYVLLHHYMGEVDGSVGAWGYARGADRRGVDIIENCEVTGFLRDGDRITGVSTTRGEIRARKVALAVAGSTGRVMQLAGIDKMPIESHVLQAFVSESLKPIIDTILTFGMGHFYISQSDKGGLVYGGDLDGYNSYAQRGSLPIVDEVMSEMLALFPGLARVRMLRSWGGLCDMTMDGSPIITTGPLPGMYLNCGWCYGGFKATPASGFCFAWTIAKGEPHELNAPFTLDRFYRGLFIDDKGQGATPRLH
ncbi:MAG: FAD-dependent oxidoreductase [Mesorhizobium sp.]|nr:MAG: FAD-dependent oxidoreductase [Mesorhizobium sp.]